MIVIATLMFFCVWFLMFFYQFRSDKKYDGRIDMKEYVFCSNMIIDFPSIIIRILFFNNRKTRLPITVVCCQFTNVIMYCYFIISTYVFNVNVDVQFLELRIWFGIFIFFLVVMVVDHEIFCMRNK